MVKANCFDIPYSYDSSLLERTQSFTLIHSVNHSVLHNVKLGRFHIVVDSFLTVVHSVDNRKRKEHTHSHSFTVCITVCSTMLNWGVFTLWSIRFTLWFTVWITGKGKNTLIHTHSQCELHCVSHCVHSVNCDFTLWFILWMSVFFPAGIPCCLGWLST